MPKNRFFQHISGIFDRKWIFSGNRAPSHFGHCHFAFLCQKSEKTNEPISRKAGNELTDGRTNGQRLIYRTSKVGPKSKSTKTALGYFSIFDRKNCFSKNLAPSHFGDCHFASLCQKKLMSQSREKLVTDGRTDGRTNERTTVNL